ncbi:hypothetical protein AbraIFM66950_005918 [Aspergillus brasiliensis]|nr:hypothetical protein AbraIFM66950_005918 [Aspergillus brasiliensis]
MVNNLLRHQIDLSALNSDGISALAMAVTLDKVEAVKAMIRHPNINLPQFHEVVPFSKTPLGQAMEAYDYKVMEMLLTDPQKRLIGPGC